jgi:HEAT repeat protein
MRSLTQVLWQAASLLGVAAGARAALPPEARERALETLTQGVGDASPEVRAWAVRGLGYLRDNQGLPQVLEALGDPEWVVQRAALLALAQLNPKDLTDRLAGAVTRAGVDPALQAMPLLGFLPETAAVPVLKKVLSQKGVALPETWAEAALAIPEQGGALRDAAFETALGSPDPAVRKAFGDASLRLSWGDSAKLLTLLLPKLSSATQIGIIERLIDYPRTPDLAFLAKLTNKDPDLLLRVEAALAAHGKPGKDTQAALVKALDAADPAVQLMALKGLRGIASEALFVALERFISEDQMAIPLARAAYAVYAKAGHPKLAEHLEKKIDDPRLSNARRAASVAVYGHFKGSEAVPKLELFLGKDEPDLRVAAAQALADVKEPKAIPKLKDALLVEQEVEVRLAEIAALGAIAHPDGLVALRFQASDRTLEVRRAAVLAMTRVKDPKAVPELVLALRDNHAEIRQTALRALMELDPKTGLEHLGSALGWLTEADLVALTSGRGAEIIGVLEPALSSTQPSVRIAAAKALPQLSAELWLPVLRKAAVTSEDPEVIVLALTAVMGAERRLAARLLKRLARHAHPRVRITALALCGEHQVWSAQDLLFDTAASEDAMTRVVAAASLVRL